VGVMGTDLESFIVFTGLKHWDALGPNSVKMMRYDWSPDFGAPVSQRYVCPYSFTNLGTYQLTFNTGCTQPIGTTVPGLMLPANNNLKLTTYDVDNDTDATENCAGLYTGSPWWYNNCWDGSIVGGGELTGQGYFNGAYWRGSAVQWGVANGAGAGNGWLYVK